MEVVEPNASVFASAAIVEIPMSTPISAVGSSPAAIRKPTVITSTTAGPP